MNKVITINLNGNAYPLEENGYEALRTYLDTAARRLEGNPDQAEIIADIEQAIADKFRAVLGANKTVVVTAEVEQIVAEMGPVEDASMPAGEQASAAGAAAGPGPQDGPKAAEPAAAPAGTPKRLYKVADGAMIGGVCNGLAAYFNIDVTIIRILFALGTVFTWGGGILLYLALLIFLPEAHTSAEKAAAYGAPSTAEEFIRRAKQGYYEGMKTFHDKRAHRAWRRNFKQEMRGWSRSFRREMQGHARQWHQTWHGAWGPPARPSLLAWIFVPIISTIIWALGLVALVAVFSLLFTGALFGVMPPHGLPWWVGILALIAAFQVLTWPLRALRYSFIFHGPGYAPPHGGGGSIAGLAFAALVIWIAFHHVPEAQRALENLPPFLHHVVDSLREWWSRR